MSSFGFVVNRFAYVVQQSCALADHDVGAELSRHIAGEIRNLDGMFEHVLSVARTEFHAAEKLDFFGMKIEHARFEHGVLARFLNLYVYLLRRFCNDILYSARVNAAVGYKFFQRYAGNFPADRIEGGQHDGIRRIVDNKIHAGSLFERFDVASFTADYAALHFVIRQRYGGNGDFGTVIDCAFLDRQRHDFFGAPVSFVLGFLLDFAYDFRRIALGLVLH